MDFFWLWLRIPIHVHKQLAILYVRRDAPTYTNNWQFCMYVKTLPCTQTIGNSVCTSSREGEWTFLWLWLRIPIHLHKQLAILYVRRDAPTYTNNWQFCMYVEQGGRMDFFLAMVTYTHPRTQTIGNSVCTSRRSHVHKQFAILYVRRDAPMYTNNWQFCMYVDTTSSQSSGMQPHFCSSWGPQVSIVRASAPGDGPRPHRPGALNALLLLYIPIREM